MSRRWVSRLAGFVLGSFCLTGTGSAYYFYVHYNTRTGPFNNPIYEKFDVNALLGGTVRFFISDQAPVMAPGDSFQAIVSEIRSAAEVWNGVGSSGIRLAYGGLFTAGTNESAPGIDVEFSDNIPPGLLAMAGPGSTGSAGPGGTFVPITRSKLYLPRDLSQVPYYGPIPSYSEQFFVTLVHEFGHTLGLQHTLTSSVMSTLWTSASSKATPLGADDIAAISQLYPSGSFAATAGSISGRVTLGGKGVNLASVVALSPSNPAISALTNPDGTYEIDGVPPGQYFVYVHPLPAAAYGESTPDNIVYPKDVTGTPLGPNYDSFVTQFYNGRNGGTRDTVQAQPLFVYAANSTPGIDFVVTSQKFSPVSTVRTYGYNTQAGVYVSPAPLSVGLKAPVVATGSGLLQNNVLTPGLSIGLLGSAAQVTDVVAYPPPTQYIAMYVLVNFTAGPGPKHLLFHTPGDLYVLPAGFTVVNDPPPTISSITATVDAAGMRAVLIAGSSFSSGTRILFDGLPGIIQQTTPDGKLLVTPPPAPTLTVTPASLSPGVDTLVEVVGVGTNFIDGQTLVGFGTSDVVVDKVTVLSPTHLRVEVVSNGFASTGGISVTTGLGIISQAVGSQVTVTNPQ